MVNLKKKWLIFNKRDAHFHKAYYVDYADYHNI